MTADPGPQFALVEPDAVRWEHLCKAVLSDGHGGTETVRFLDSDTLPVGADAPWELVSSAPITLHPAMLCNRCGLEGQVRNGEWVPKT